jgi:hypothetical protein
MPVLGDYLGLLLSEITNARLQADLESVRIAQLYAAHPLLQHMPVPRFRLPNVTLDLPVAVEKIEPAPGAAMPAPDLSTPRRRIEEIIDQGLATAKIPFSSIGRAELKHALDDTFDRLKSLPSLSAAETTQASEHIITAVVEVITKSGEGRTLQDTSVESALRRPIGLEFVKLHSAPERVQVIVGTVQLKDLGPSQNLTRLQLTISEEGVEWTQTNPSDTSSRTLLRE